jgi:hypothetical protein
MAETPSRTPAESPNRKLSRRQGWAWPAIRRVLAAADTPMRPVQIYVAARDLEARALV